MIEKRNKKTEREKINYKIIWKKAYLYVKKAFLNKIYKFKYIIKQFRIKIKYIFKKDFFICKYYKESYVKNDLKFETSYAPIEKLYKIRKKYFEKCTKNLVDFRNTFKELSSI